MGDRAAGSPAEPAHGSGRPVVAVVGPTGTGKSDLAIAVAQRFDGEIINADALQFYRGLDIGTAKVPADQRGGVPHHLLDTLDPLQESSAAQFQEHSRQIMDDLWRRGRLPVLVGGTGLYVRAALDAIEFPPTDARVRARLEQELARTGHGALRGRLREVDPESAATVKDDRRLVRALEVHEITGRPFTSYMPQRRYVVDALQLGLDMDRSVLHQRLEARVEAMMAAGLMEEVAELERRGLLAGRTASMALGYRQCLQALRGEITREEAARLTVTATRQFARRQLTWFRADGRVNWLDAADPRLQERAFSLICDHLRAVRWTP